MLICIDSAHMDTLKSFTRANEHNRNTPIQLEINIFTHEAHRYTHTHVQVFACMFTRKFIHTLATPFKLVY